MLDISKIRAITLDLDDTLWPIWPTIARAEQALHTWLVEFAPVAAALVADTPSRLALRDHVVQAYPDMAHDMGAVRKQVLRLALQRSNEDVALVDPAYEVFVDHRMKVDLFDDALPALEFLARRFPLVSVSNGNADIHRVGLGAHFHASISAHVLGVAKPDPRIFEAAAASAGVGPQAVLHIGDDAHLDVLGARRAGMQTVWVNRTAHDWVHDDRPHLEVSDLHQLCVLLKDVPVVRAQPPK